MRNLGVAEYTFEEDSARRKLPIEMTAAFADGNAIRRCSHEAELLQYFEASPGRSCEDYFKSLLQPITPEEFDAMQDCMAHALRFSETLYGKAALGRGAILGFAKVYRELRSLYSKRPIRILELNPDALFNGCWYPLNGYSYCALETRQPNYLLQNHLWNVVLGNRFVETIQFGASPELLQQIGNGLACHIPWWLSCTLPVEQLSEVDVVLLNRSIWELPDLGQTFLLRLSGVLLAGTGSGLKAVLLTEWQDYDAPTKLRALDRLESLGFAVAGLQNGFAVAVPSGHDIAAYALHREAGDGALPESFPTEPGPIIDMRRCHEEVEKEWRFIRYDQFHTLCTLLLGTETYTGEAERFFNFLRT